MYGAIERIRIVKDRKGKSRSYAFIVYERERDMKGTFTILPTSNKANVQPPTRMPKVFPSITSESWSMSKEDVQ
jgi:RNA recognition motif-containing protein